MPETIDDKAIRFDKKEHRCFRGDERLPSVGTVLRNAAKAFNPWAKDDWTPQAQARMDRGKQIHSTLELYEKGDLQTFDKQIEPFIVALVALKQHLGVAKWDGIEEWAADGTRGYWGILDRHHESCGVLDIKTGTSRQSSYRVQVAGYCILKRTKLGAVVYLPQDRPFDPAQDIHQVTKDDFDAFKWALKLMNR